MADEYPLPELDGFDLSSFVPPTTGAQAPKPVSPGMLRQPSKMDALGGMGGMAPLMMLLPALLKGGGTGNVAAFLNGMQQAQQRKQQTGQQQFQNNRLLQSDEHQAQQDFATEEYRKQQLQNAFRQRVMSAAGNLESPEGAKALLDFLGPEATQLGLDPTQVGNYVNSVATPSKLEQKAAQKYVKNLEQTYGHDWTEKFAGAVFTPKGVALPKNPVTGATRPISAQELLALAGTQVAGAPLPKPAKPDVPNTPEEQTLHRYAVEHGYKSWGEVPYDEQLRVKAQVATAGRAPEKPTGAEKPLTANQRANVIGQRRSQWQRFTKSVIDRQSSIAKIDAGLSALDRGNRNAATQSIIIAFNKLNDETSVVREGEYARSEQLVPLVNRIEGAIQRITLGGASMKDADLRALAQEAKNIAKSLEAVTNNAAANLRQAIEEEMADYGIPTTRVFGGSSIGTRSTPPADTPPPPATTSDRYQRYLKSKKGAN